MSQPELGNASLLALVTLAMERFNRIKFESDKRLDGLLTLPLSKSSKKT